MDADHIDPAGYVAIRPLGQDKCALIFIIVVRWADSFDPRNLIFHSMLEAKRCLDMLLAADTPKSRSRRHETQSQSGKVKPTSQPESKPISQQDFECSLE